MLKTKMFAELSAGAVFKVPDGDVCINLENVKVFKLEPVFKGAARERALQMNAVTHSGAKLRFYDAWEMVQVIEDKGSKK